MNSTLTPELFWLTLVTLLTSVMWVPYIINWIAENGVVDALWRPMNFDHSQPRARWAVRMLRAHENDAGGKFPRRLWRAGGAFSGDLRLG